MKEWYINLDPRSQERIGLAITTRAPLGVGAFITGNVLLIGEQASDPENAPEQQAFCDNRGCSGWLNKQLDSDQIPENKLFWLNARNNDGSFVDLRAIVDALQPSYVIALGGVAKKSCVDQAISHQVAYHPQYWKRFKSKHRYPLLDMLQQYLKNVPDRVEMVKCP